MTRGLCAALALGLLLAAPAWAADGPPWRPDYSTPERTVLTYCLARNLPEGGREIMARAFLDGANVMDSMYWQIRTMCRVSEVKPVYDGLDKKNVLPNRAEVILEEWDPVQGDTEEFIGRRWFFVHKVGEKWKITDSGAVCNMDYPPDDIFVCREQPWWNQPELSAPMVVVCNYAFGLTEGYPPKVEGFMAPGVIAPVDLIPGVFSADVVAVRSQSLAGNASAAGPLPEEAEVDLDVSGFVPGKDMTDSRYKFTVRRFGDEWRIARIEYLGRRPDPVGEGN